MGRQTFIIISDGRLDGNVAVAVGWICNTHMHTEDTNTLIFICDSKYGLDVNFVNGDRYR